MIGDKTMDSQSLTHLQDEDRWAYWPIQPMRKPVTGNMPDVGIVVAGRTSVYEINMYEFKGQLEGIPHTDYDSYQSMLTDGWRVD